MDNNTTPVATAPKRNTARMALSVIAVLLVVASTVISVLALQEPPSATDITALSSPADMKAGAVYRIDSLHSAGVFMYTGAADGEGEKRQNGKGTYIDKAHILTYHTLAMVEDNLTGEKYLLTFSTTKKDGEVFDRVAAHDKAENESGDNGAPITVSAYVKAVEMKGEVKAQFKKTKAEYQATAGMEKVEWSCLNLEYICDGDEDYMAIATAEKRKWLAPALYMLPIAAVLLLVALIKPKSATAEEPSATEETENNV